mmetsp:Transcript_22196/g.50713  ORF Transcript_22196/g.50713 Transcript_22196/m.50713 type:complete len:203 (-) Transcript_22196:43-651(-)
MHNGAWPPNMPFVMQPVTPQDSVRQVHGQEGCKNHGGVVPEWVLQGGYLTSAPGQMAQVAGSGHVAASVPPPSERFKYAPTNIVLAAGQYREIRPTVADKVGVHFHIRGPPLPEGMQLDPATGTLWGVPAKPLPNLDAARPYTQYTVVATGPSWSASAQVGLKVIDFADSRLQVTHVSQMEQNKYMVLVDMRSHAPAGNFGS